MRPATLAIIGTALGAAAGHAFRAPFPGMGGNPVLDLIAYHDPGLHSTIRVWYYAAPAVAVVLAGSVCLSVWRVWLQPPARGGGRGRLPAWPASPEDDAPSLVIGELHHPVVPRESERPSWLVIPETGLYTGVLVVGAVGTGKTTACMYPFAQQLLSCQPQVAGVFCPPPPAEEEPPDEAASDENDGAGHPVPGLRRRLPPLSELIEGGKVLALNMPAGANPALARAIGVLLKNAWMQALLRRPAEAARRPGRYLRPAVFICDEYQAFATVGQDDPSGDEKAFALTRQCRCVPIVATQSISSLRSVLPGGEAWRTLLQTLRTRIFLSLSDESSARIASEMCGSVMKTQPSYTFTETTGRPEFSLLSGRAGGGRGTIGASKSFRQQREPVFTPREFALLANYQAICLPYDGTKSFPARRVYLKPHYLPRDVGYWRLREEGRI